jgi:hypothetical protein
VLVSNAIHRNEPWALGDVAQLFVWLIELQLIDLWSANSQCIMKERPAKRRRAPPPLRYAVQGFAPLRRRLGVTAMVNRVGEDYRRT